MSQGGFWETLSGGWPRYLWAHFPPGRGGGEPWGPGALAPRDTPPAPPASPSGPGSTVHAGPWGHAQSPIWRRRWSTGERGQWEQGGASRSVYLHSRHHGYLGAWTLSWPQRQRFSQPGVHRAPVPGSRQLSESGCSTPPAARRQKTAPCVGTHGPIPLVTRGPGPVPLGTRQLPVLPHPDESFPQ